MNIRRSTISGNFAGAGGAGGDPGSSGLGTGPAGTTTGGNGGSGGLVGGLTSGGSEGDFESDNLTLFGNSAGDGGPGGPGGSGPAVSTGGNGANGGEPGGMAVTGGNALLTHTTIAANQSGGAGVGGDGGTGNTTSTDGLTGDPGDVGGFRASGGATVFRNTLIADNSGNQCGGSMFSNGGHTLSFPDDLTCPAGLHGNPLLGDLADNGGSTPTVALGAGSAAIDAIPSLDPNCLDTDQRGIARHRGAGCDIGAFESARPLVTTGASSAVTATTAQLAGLVNPNTRATTYRFAFGKTAAYGSLTAPVNAGSGAAAVAAGAALTGLAPNTLYTTAWWRPTATAP